jgi:6-phosphogluconolactonase
MSGTIDAFHYDAHSGKLTPFQRVPSTPKGFTGDPGSADIHIGPDGRFLYASNRGISNTLAVYAIGKEGKLTAKQFLSVNGKHPRNFAIDPSGHYLLVANRDTDNIDEFSIDQTTGLLKATGNEIKVPNPVCVKFLTP